MNTDSIIIAASLAVTAAMGPHALFLVEYLLGTLA